METKQDLLKEQERLINLRVYYAEIGDYDNAWKVQEKINKLGEKEKIK